MWCSDRRRRRGWARVGTAAVVLALTAVGPVGPVGHVAASSPLEDCIARKVDAGMTRPIAQAECIKEVGPATASTTRPTTAPADDREDDSNDRPTASGDGGGTSMGALLGVGLAGLVVGAGLTALLLRRRPSPGPTAPLGAPVAGVPPQPFGTAPASPFAGPPGAAPAPVAAPGPTDRGPALIVALVDLADRVNSQALRSDVLAALARVGVQQIEIRPGEPFDPNRMRGVGSEPTPDPSLVGRVAATDRPGFRDGAQLIRLPDVVVHVAG